MIKNLLILAFSFVSLYAYSEETYFGHAIKPLIIIPDEVEIKLESKKKSYFVGENINIIYKITNNSKKTVLANFGGDYRGGRSTRFKVSIKTIKGAIAKRTPSVHNFGGFSRTIKIKPEKSYSTAVHILKYYYFDLPGEYEISIHHDCGWVQSKSKKYAVKKIIINIKTPNKEEIKKVIKKGFQRNFEKPNRADHANPAFDFTLIRQKEYLPALVESALIDKNKGAITGISSLHSTDATKALLKLCHAPDKKIATEAFNAVEIIISYKDNLTLKKSSLKVWLPEFNKEILTIAETHLKNYTKGVQITALQILRKLPSKDNLPIILSYFDENITSNPLYRDAHQGRIYSALNCIKSLMPNKCQTTEPTSSYGTQFMRLLIHNKTKESAPSFYQNTYKALLENKNPLIVFIALNNAPNPFPKTLIKDLEKEFKAFLTINDQKVRMSTLKIVRENKLNIFSAEILSLIKTADNQNLFNEAFLTAKVLKLNKELVPLLLNKINQADYLSTSISYLSTHIDINYLQNNDIKPLTKKERDSLKDKWLLFFKKYSHLIKAGKKIPFPNKDFTKDMLPIGYYFKLNDNNIWPKNARTITIIKN